MVQKRISARLRVRGLTGTSGRVGFSGFCVPCRGRFYQSSPGCLACLESAACSDRLHIASPQAGERILTFEKEAIMFARWIPLALLGVCAGVAGAEELLSGEPPLAQVSASCPAACGPAPCDKTVCHKQVLLVPTQEATILPQINIREVATRVPATTLAVEFKEEKRCVTVTTAKPREEERVVYSTTLIPETTVDPCTGRCCTTYREVCQSKVVKVQVIDHVCETKEVTVKVPVLKQVPTEYVVKQLTADWTSRPAVQTRLDAVVIPTEMKIPAVGCPLPA